MTAIAPFRFSCRCGRRWRLGRWRGHRRADSVGTGPVRACCVKALATLRRIADGQGWSEVRQHLNGLMATLRHLGMLRALAPVGQIRLRASLSFQPGTGATGRTVREEKNKYHIEIVSGIDHAHNCAVALHELAHVAAWPDHHGRRWRQSFLRAAAELT